MDSMYKGMTKFSQHQLRFMAEVILCAALDRIESQLPSTPSDLPHYEEFRASGKMEVWIQSSLECAGHGLAVLCAQLTDDGMGTCDALEACKLEPLVRKLVRKRMSKKWEGFKEGEKTIPDVSHLAKAFVKKYLSEESIFIEPAI